MGRCFTLVAIAVTLASPLLAVQPRVLHTLEPVLVTANPWYVPAARLGFKSQSITQEAIQETGALEIGDVMNTLTNGNSVNTGHQNSIFIRGLPSRFSKVLINGMDMKDPVSINGSPFWDGLNLSSIDEIQYIEGSQGALLGASAVSGALNFVFAPNGTETTIKTSDGYHQIGFKTGKTVGKWQWVSAFNTVSDTRYSAKVTSSSQPDIDPYLSTNAFGSLAWEDAQFRFKSQAMLTDTFTYIDSAAATDRLRTLTGRYGNQLEWASRSNEKIGIQYNLSTLSRDDSSYSGSLYQGTMHTIDSYAQWNIGNTVAITGIEYQLENGSSTYTPFRVQNTAAIYGASTHKFGEIELNESIRLISDYRNRLRVVAGAGVSASLNSEIQVRSNINSGFRSPSLYENSNAQTQLSPENATTGDLGLWGTLGWIKGHVSAFYSVVQDRIDYSYTTYTYGNIADQTKVRGAEIGVEIPGIGRITYERTDSSTSSLGREARIPDFKWTANAGYTIGRVIAVSAQFQSVGSRRDALPNPYVTDATLAGYALTDVTVRYIGSPEWTPYFAVTNIFDKQYEQAGGYTTPGRTFILGLTYRVD